MIQWKTCKQRLKDLKMNVLKTKVMLDNELVGQQVLFGNEALDNNRLAHTPGTNSAKTSEENMNRVSGRNSTTVNTNLPFSLKRKA